MKIIPKSIAVLQSDLNKRLVSVQPGLFKDKAIYSLSLRLDKEIVKYYREVMNQ